ncbi:OmpA family protein [Gammaproteobacteria bacterium]|jgi:outer membrane protein OmpA-like peptidoglycan-associated protein|nr:OmpA family protein [Gammaproteobacteria bacterium]
MYKTISVITVTALLAAAPALAGVSPKEERIGVGTGAVVGAIAAGPIGFIVGATIGAKIGDTMYQKNETIDTLAASLDSSRDHVAGLNDDVDNLGAELERMRRVARPELVGLLQAGIAMDLLFRTDEHALADTTGDRLAALAGMLATMPDIRIQLDGFADERGDKDYNLLLSQKRVEFVRDQLIAAGIDAARIRVAAHGEAPAQDSTADSYALERRVNMTVFIDDSQSFASAPNQTASP